MMIRLLSLMLLVASLSNCRSAQNTNREINSTLEGVLGKNYSCTVNADSTLILCKTVPEDSTKTGILHLNFAVAKFNDSSIVYTDRLQHAQVNWIENNEILVDRALGYLNERNAREKYIIDVNSLKRRPVSDDYKAK